VNTAGNRMVGGFLRGDRYEVKHATMSELIQTAYGVDADKVYGGPSWLDYDKYEVSAKAKAGTTPATLHLMLRALLEDRFKLVVNPDTKDAPAYVLTSGKGKVDLKASQGANGGGCMMQPFVRTDGDAPVNNIQCRNVTMEEFAAGLRRLTPATFANLAVVDQTGIEGTYDIDLPYALLSATSAQPGTGGLLGAIGKLGLKLERGMAPQPVLSVVSVNEIPTPNAAGIETSLPPLPPAQFEVASIRPCDLNGPGPNINVRFEAGARVTMRCMFPSILINRVFGLAPGEEPLGKPKWMGNNSQPAYTMEATAPADAIPSGVSVAQQQEILSEMILGLLRERWGLRTHWEQRPMDALTLMAVKPKLTKADPAGRTGCTRQSLPGTGLMLALACKNMTMAQFAEQVRGFSAMLFYPVEDGTNLEGAWDFSVTYSVQASIGIRAPGAGPAAEASEPSGQLSFNEAVEKQLGLKFETHKRPEPVLVIDHIEEKPSEN
jgi:uncharacterized protein (TIGR03435 family)